MVQFNIITFKKSYSQKIMNSKDKTKALEYVVRKKKHGVILLISR